jgi:hypothetical protein
MMVTLQLKGLFSRFSAVGNLLNFHKIKGDKNEVNYF